MDETLVAILSDCHVGAWNSPEYQGVKFAECIARVLALDPLPAKMFILGDLAYAPTACCGYIHGHDHRWYVTRSLTR